MSLDHYLSSEGAPTAADFAERVGVSAMSISRIRKGEQNITRDTMRAIIRESGGLVTAESLVGITEAESAPEAAQGPFPAARKAGQSPSSPICSETRERRAESEGIPPESERRCSAGPAIMPRDRRPNQGVSA